MRFRRKKEADMTVAKFYVTQQTQIYFGGDRNESPNRSSSKLSDTAPMRK